MYAVYSTGITEEEFMNEWYFWILRQKKSFIPIHGIDGKVILILPNISQEKINDISLRNITKVLDNENPIKPTPTDFIPAYRYKDYLKLSSKQKIIFTDYMKSVVGVKYFIKQNGIKIPVFREKDIKEVKSLIYYLLKN